MSLSADSSLAPENRPNRTHVTSAARANAVSLGCFFGAVYFVQGIGEPTEGLIAQPVRSLLRNWDCSATEITLFATLLSVPWWFKPLYGLLSDFVPLAGYRRRSYLLVSTAATVAGLLYVAFAPLTEPSLAWLLAVLLIPTVGVAFSDVVADALMVEKGQPTGLTGRLQSIQWTCMQAASVIVGSLGGYLSQHGLQRTGFLICAFATLATFLLTVFYVQEEPQPRRRGEWSRAVRELKHAAQQRAVWAVGAFLFLWNFNPFSTSVLYLYMTDELGLSEQFYGHTVSLMSGAMMFASMAYGFYCRRVAFSVLVHVSIVLGIVSTVAYWGLSGQKTAIVISLLIGFSYMTANLIQFDFAARVCPPASAATVFALLMALSNAGLSLSILAGGYLYEFCQHWWGPHRAFQLLVLIGTLTTAACWLLMPLLISARLPRTQAVDQYGGDNDGAFDDQLIVRRDHQEIHPVVDGANQQRADQGTPDAASSTRQTGAADDN
jgi:MFS family permease